MSSECFEEGYRAILVGGLWTCFPTGIGAVRAVVLSAH